MGSGRGPVAREPGEAAQPTQATCHRWPQPRATECAAPCPALHAKTWAACRQVTDGGQKCGQMHPAQAGAIKKERGTEKLQRNADNSHPRDCRHDQPSWRYESCVIRSFS